MPCIVRPKENGRYEMVSGHRRKHAAIRAGLNSLPCIVRDLDDIQATILMVDSNAHRPYILPSEKAYSYKMKLEAMKRQAGRPNIENGVPVGHNSFVGKSREILAAESQDSNTQIQRYVRLTYLIPELLQMVDNSVEKPTEAEALSMAMRPAVELSYLTPENQKIVLDFMQDTLSTPSHAQAIQLREMQNKGILNPQGIYDLLAQEKPNQKLSSKIPINRFSRYFPPNTSAEDIEKGIFKALDFYQKAEERRKSAQEYIRKREQKHYDNSTSAAKELLAEMNGKYEESRMGYRYTVNRKPHPYDYDNLSEFFNKGEKRLAPNVNGGFYVQEWDGNKFIPADNEYVNIKYSAKVEKSDEELADIADENSSNDKCMDGLNPIRHREPPLSL